MAATEHVRVKLERLDPEDYFRAPGVCDERICVALAAKVAADKLQPHSDVTDKTYQRDCAHELIAELLRIRSRVNIYVFDDLLQRIGADNARLFIEEVVARHGAARVRVWSPNLSSTIVTRLHGITKEVAPNVTDQPWLTAGYKRGTMRRWGRGLVPSCFPFGMDGGSETKCIFL